MEGRRGGGGGGGNLPGGMKYIVLCRELSPRSTFSDFAIDASSSVPGGTSSLDMPGGSGCPGRGGGGGGIIEVA